MHRVDITEIRPGVRIRQISTGRESEVVAPLQGESVELGRTWVNVGAGPEQINDNDLDVILG